MRTYAEIEEDYDRTLGDIQKLRRQITHKNEWLNHYAREHETLRYAGVIDTR